MKADLLRPAGEFASGLVKLALKKGADQAEVYVKSARNLLIEVKQQEIDAVESSLSSGYSLRVICGNRLGFSYSTSAEDMESVVRDAVESASWADRDEHLALPGKAAAPCNAELEIYDEETAGMKEQDAIRRVLSIEKAANDFDSRIKKTRKASGLFALGEVVISNSNGVDVSYQYTKCTAQVMTVAEEGGESQMGWDFDGSRSVRDISFEGVGRNAAKRAVQLLGSRKISTIKAPAIIDNSVASEFLGIFASSVSAESVQKGRSLLRDRIDQKVISSKINLVDSGIMKGRPGTRPYDDEGVPSSETILINEGILQGYLYNTYTAKKGGTGSTGNAVRGGYAGIPSVGITNLCLKAVSSADVIPFGSLLGSLNKGLYITEAMGVHTANPISGEFSIGVSGLWIENGEIKFPVKEAVVSGDILSLFSKVEAAGDDMRFYGNIGTPSLLVGPIDISG